MVEGLLRTAALKDGSASQTPSVKLKRLTRKEEVQRVFSEGRKFVSPSFVIFSLKYPFPDLLYAIHIRKKLGSAVERNRIKRVYREALRRQQISLRGHKLVVIPRVGSKLLTLNQVSDQIKALFPKPPE
ncbi:ribonuclease P protein component [Candidatus Manganitrophus noduliformans]|uniref:Ribonuclease P protein component n=1 Tax=Candidatus Manganitrophus noduliformans TaxID=2606439 RepID=A0A7X6I9I8_9BACT|nr:ribonuclease P protein component [Candidatus Manganitrophus noduliformans]NKE69518.1 ribonuclease P protein component [Candidatus Manganitrophus noduliformans]